MKKIILRALSEGDIPRTLKWNNQDEIKQLYSGHPFPVNLERETDWYERVLRSNIPISIWAIELLQTNMIIGLSMLKNINLIHRNAEFAIIIGEREERGKGYSKKAAFETLKFGFYQLGLHRIYLHVLAHNKVAVNLFKELGFSKEGELRETNFKDGIFYNEFIMSILSGEFKSSNEL